MPVPNLTILRSDEGDDTEFRQNMRRMQELKRQHDPNYLTTFTANDLMEKQYISRPPIIENLLLPGAYLLVGAPKIGKSFLVAQIAYHVSEGKTIWGRPVQKGGVLYLALEDDERRLQARFARMFGVEGSDNLNFATVAGSLYDNLTLQLNNYLARQPDTSLIIIDTLQKIRDSLNEYSYGKDYDIIGQLKAFADNHGICVLLVHHSRKQRADDAFDMISGTNGLLGSADGCIMMSKVKRTDQAATLELTSRDLPDQKLHLLRDEATLVWELESEEKELWKAPPDPLLEKIAMILASQPSWTGSATELVEILSESMNPNILTRMLNTKSDVLKNKYGITFSSKHTRTGRFITLSKAE